MVFHTPIIWYVNSFFQKFHIMAASDIYADCLEMHKSRMKEAAYDDLHIVNAIFADMEVLFKREFITQGIKLEYLGSPYDLCEQVIGARQFVVSHEVAHLVVNNTGGDEGIPLFQNNLLKAMPDLLNDTQARAWAIELWCDEFAIRTLNQLYLSMPAGQRRQDIVGNALRGILLFLFMLYIMEQSLGTHDTNLPYPPATFRYQLVCNTVRQLRLYEDEFTQTGLRGFHYRLGMARKVLAGLTASVKYGPMSVALELDGTEFSRRLSRRLFEHIRGDDEIGPDRSPWARKPFG